MPWELICYLHPTRSSFTVSRPAAIAIGSSDNEFIITTVGVMEPSPANLYGMERTKEISMVAKLRA